MVDLVNIKKEEPTISACIKVYMGETLQDMDKRMKREREVTFKLL
jgi:hypothetical protein